MKLYLLSRLDRVGYDETESMLIRAESEMTARTMANKSSCGDEVEIWENSALVSVEEITVDGPAELIILAFNAG